MSDQTLTGWEASAAIALIALLPGQSYDTALAYIQTYVGGTGGWTPDSSSDPTGQGVPANGQTPSQAAASVAANQFGCVYEANVAIPLTLQLCFVQKLSSGLNEAAVISAIKDDVVSWIETLIADSDLPIAVVANSAGSISGALTGTGLITPAERVGIAAAIASGEPSVDYRVTALQFAQNTYGLNTLWNVSTIYTESQTAIHIGLGLFNDSTYGQLDPTATKSYLITIEPEQYQVISGVIQNI